MLFFFGCEDICVSYTSESSHIKVYSDNLLISKTSPHKFYTYCILGTGGAVLNCRQMPLKTSCSIYSRNAYKCLGIYCIYVKAAVAYKQKYWMNIYILCTNVQIKNVLSTYSKRWQHGFACIYTDADYFIFLKCIFADRNATADTLFAGNIVTCEKCSVFLFLSLGGSSWPET
jgi:hypothetical protein